MGTPSTTYKGSFPAESDLRPRISILELPPGAALPIVTCTPGAAPRNISLILVVGILLICSVVTDDMAPVISLRFCTPYPTTTTSFSDSTDGINCTVYS